MTTKIFGASDDLIEFRGDVHGEVGYFDAGEKAALIVCSDGTLLSVGYGKGELAVWYIVPMKGGDLFVEVDQCFDEDADPYSDVAHFKDGLKWAYVATEWQKAE